MLRGTVVSSVDKTPIRSALVQLLGEKPRAMLTGADGSFQFEGLAAGDATITARKPGYFSPQEYYPESVGERVVHLMPNLAPVELKLYPEAVIFGRVTNENGRPLEGVTVQLVPTAAKNPTRKLEDLPNTLTNENGEYRLAELHAGTYLVSASRKINANGPIAFFQASKLSYGYPTYFYPNVTDSSLATPVRITPGKQVQADLRLTMQPLFRISGTVQGISAGAPVVVVMVGQHDVEPVAASVVAPGLNSFVLEGVPAGSYFLGALQAGPGDTVGEKTGITRVEVTENREGVSIVLAEKKTIPMRYRFESAQPNGNMAQDPGVSVSFERTDLAPEAGLFTETYVPGRSEISLDPGTYRAKINAATNRCVASIRSGGTDIAAEDLVVTAAGPVEPIELVVRDDCGRVQGSITKDGQPTMGRVFLIPESEPRRGISVAANSDGKFEFQGLLPGSYFAVALDGADDLDPEDPEALKAVKGRATEVEVQPSAEVSVSLELKSLER